jgi:hypothetical protein
MVNTPLRVDLIGLGTDLAHYHGARIARRVPLHLSVCYGVQCFAFVVAILRHVNVVSFVVHCNNGKFHNANDL